MHTICAVPTYNSGIRSLTVFHPGVEKLRCTLSPSPICSPRRVPLRYFQIRRQSVVQGVVDVNVIGVSTKYGPSDAAAVAVSVVAALATGTTSRVETAASAASFPNTSVLLLGVGRNCSLVPGRVGTHVR